MLFPPQDSSSVIQFMTRAKVKVDAALRVVEIANGNPEEMTVSQPAGGQPFSEGEGVWVAWCWSFRVKTVCEPRWWLCGGPKTRPALAPGPRGQLLWSALAMASFSTALLLCEGSLLRPAKQKPSEVPLTGLGFPC